MNDDNEQETLYRHISNGFFKNYKTFFKMLIKSKRSNFTSDYVKFLCDLELAIEIKQKRKLRIIYVTQFYVSTLKNIFLKKLNASDMLSINLQ